MPQPDHYVQTDCSIIDHPKTHLLADKLDCHPVDAVGVVQSFRCRVMRFFPSGDITGLTEKMLSAWLMRYPKLTLQTLVDCGVIDKSDGRMVMHGWERYERKEKRRAENAERERERRARHVGNTKKPRGAHVGNTCPKSVQAEEEEESKDDDGAPTATELRRDLLDRWNTLAARHGLPKVRADDAPAWADKANARIAEGILERWSDVEARVVELMAEPRHRERRPTWLKFTHLLHNDKNWRQLASEGEGAKAASGQASRDILDAAHSEIARAAILEVLGPGQRNATYSGRACRLSVTDSGGGALAMYSDNTASCLYDDILATITPMRDSPAVIADAARRFLRERVVTYSEAS